MAKLLTQKNVLIAVASFFVIWYAVVHRRFTEHMTGADLFSTVEKRAITDTIIQKVIPPQTGTKAPELTANAKKFLTFLEQNPVTTIDDRFIEKLTEFVKKMSTNSFLMRKLLEDPDFVKKGARWITSLLIAEVIWVYADTYEKLQDPPSPSDFKKQLTTILSTREPFKFLIGNLKNNLTREPEITRKMIANQQNIAALDQRVNSVPGPLRDLHARTMQPIRNRYQQEIDSGKSELDIISMQRATLGDDSYPLAGSASPLVNQIFDIAYKYYFGEIISAAGLAKGAWTAIVATLGSIGAIAAVGAIVYFVFLR